jgi:hypothetical protein
MWHVEYTDEFFQWWQRLSEHEHIDLTACIGLLEEQGPNLKFPHSSGINGSGHSHMRELRIQHAGEPYRILYAFDPRRTAILLIGGNKTGKDNWYKKYILIADKLYQEHINILSEEGLING